jgi:hypothetical protein
MMTTKSSEMCTCIKKNAYNSVKHNVIDISPFKIVYIYIYIYIYIYYPRYILDLIVV